MQPFVCVCVSAAQLCGVRSFRLLLPLTSQSTDIGHGHCQQSSVATADSDS